MKKTKKLVALILLITMALTIFTGCGGNNDSSNDTIVESRTVVDATGREITVPGEINRVVIMSTMPLCSVYCMAGGLSQCFRILLGKGTQFRHGRIFL